VYFGKFVIDKFFVIDKIFYANFFSNPLMVTLITIFMLILRFKVLKNIFVLVLVLKILISFHLDYLPFY